MSSLFKRFSNYNEVSRFRIYCSKLLSRENSGEAVFCQYHLLHHGFTRPGVNERKYSALISPLPSFVGFAVLLAGCGIGHMFSLLYSKRRLGD